MIQCPQCGQDVADDSFHCGHCGHKLTTSSGKKTMFGFAAVSAEEMAEAAEQAKAARAAKAASTNAPDPMIASSEAPTSALPAMQADDPMTIPTPAISAPSSFKLPSPAQTLGEESSSVFDLQKPGRDPTVNVDSVGPPPASSQEPAWATSGPAHGAPDPMAGPQGQQRTDNSGFVAETVDEQVGRGAGPGEQVGRSGAGPGEQVHTPSFDMGRPANFDMTPGPRGGALVKKGPPVALMVGIAAVVFFILCVIATAVGMIFF